MSRTIPVRSDVRRKSQIEVLNFLCVNGAQPRVNIASQIKLTKAAVTNLTNTMLESGILVERGELPPQSQKRQRGRRRIMLDVNENYRLVFGLTISSTALHIGLTNLKGQTLSHALLPIDGMGYRDLLETIVSQIQQIIRDNCITMEQILAAGVCLSTGTEATVEGDTAADKLGRLTKDLAYALPMPLIPATTCMGALIAQKLFADRQAESILLFRYGQEYGCAALTNGHIYRGAHSEAGGFVRMLKSQPEPASYSQWLEHPLTADGTNPLLNARLADMLRTAVMVMDPEKVVVLGDYFETPSAVESINRLLQEQGITAWKIEPAVVSESASYLAGCAAAIASCFYMRQF